MAAVTIRRATMMKVVIRTLLPLLLLGITVHHGDEGHDVFVTSLSVKPQPQSQPRQQQTQSPESPKLPIIQWIRSCVELESVDLSYEQTLWRKLTSSEPRRDYALKNITLSIIGGGSKRDLDDSADGDRVSGKERHQQSIASESASVTSISPSSFILLVGASSSGKSALLKVLAGSKSPTNGLVRQWTDACIDTNTDTDKISAASSKDSIPQSKPIILDDRNPYSTSTRHKSLQERLEERLEQQHGDVTTKKAKQILHDIAEACGLASSPSASSVLLHKSPTELSPSEYYKLRLAEACIDSSCYSGLLRSDGTIDDEKDGDDVGYDGDANNEKTTTTSTKIQIPGPVLFLDEWFDVETSEVVRNVQPSLESIVQNLNGIVICVTHKQHLFDVTTTATKETFQNPTSDKKHGRITRITLSGGKILSID